MKKKQVIQKFTSLKYHNHVMTEREGVHACWEDMRGQKERTCVLYDENRNLPKQHANLKFWSKKILKEIQKGHCIRTPYEISV